jgi:hypothetical protein
LSIHYDPNNPEPSSRAKQAHALAKKKLANTRRYAVDACRRAGVPISEAALLGKDHNGLQTVIREAEDLRTQQLLAASAEQYPTADRAGKHSTFVVPAETRDDVRRRELRTPKYAPATSQDDPEKTAYLTVLLDGHDASAERFTPSKPDPVLQGALSWEQKRGHHV